MTKGPWAVDNYEVPWTCGDSETAIALGQPLGHTEILFPIVAGDEIVCYMPWEPLADSVRQAELRDNAKAIARLPQTIEALDEAASNALSLVRTHMRDLYDQYAIGSPERVVLDRLFTRIEDPVP